MNRGFGARLDSGLGAEGAHEAIHLDGRDGLAASGRHLQCGSRKPVVVSLVLGLEPPAPVGVTMVPSSHLGEEDRRLGRLALREDHAVLAILVGPVLEQLTGDRRDAAGVFRTGGGS